MLRETGWSWREYLETPLSVVERLLEKLDAESKQRDRDARKAKRSRGPK